MDGLAALGTGLACLGQLAVASLEDLLFPPGKLVGRGDTADGAVQADDKLRC